MNAGGTIAGQLILLLALPLIAMGYKPEEVGEYNFLFSSGYLLACMLCFKLEMGILKEKEEDALLAYRICNRIALANLFFLFCLMLLFSHRSSSDFLYVVFLGAFWHLVAVGHYLSVQRRYLTLSIIKIVPPLLFLVALAFSVFFEMHVPMLDLQATSFGLFALLFYLSVLLQKNVDNRVVDFGVCRSFFKKYKQIFYCQLPADFLNDISRFSMPLLIPFFFGNHAAGLYMLASRLMLFPLTLLATSLGVVFRREAIAVVHQKDQFVLMFRSVFFLLFFLMIFYVVAGFFLVKPFVQLIFSEAWSGSVDVAIALIPYAAMAIMYETLSHVFFILNRQKYHLMICSAILIVVFLIFIASGYFGFEFLESLYFFSLSVFFIQFVGVLLCCRCVNGYVEGVA